MAETSTPTTPAKKAASRARTANTKNARSHVKKPPKPGGTENANAAAALQEAAAGGPLTEGDWNGFYRCVGFYQSKHPERTAFNRITMPDMVVYHQDWQQGRKGRAVAAGAGSA